MQVRDAGRQRGRRAMHAYITPVQPTRLSARFTGARHRRAEDVHAAAELPSGYINVFDQCVLYNLPIW